MLIERTSMLSGITRTRDLAITQQQIDQWNAGGLIQNIMPELSCDDREFIMTGITTEEWNANMGDEE